jgi:hypothetical protein
MVRIKLLALAALVGLALGASPTPAPTIAPLGAPNYAPAATDRGGAHDFDFEFGTWRTHYRLLKDRLVHSHVWYDCYGTSIVVPYWSGSGNLEDGDLKCPHRYIGGMTLRLYDARTRQWTIWWGTRELGLSPPQQIGHYTRPGFGQFFAHDTWKGTPIICRFQWSVVRGNPRFEQAFSTDGGKTWETNWTTDYVRVPASSRGVWNIADPRLPYDGFNFLLGRWRLRARQLGSANTWSSCSGVANVRPFWGGDANLEDDALHCGSQDVHTVAVRLFRDGTHRWLLYGGTQNAGVEGGMPAAGAFKAPQTGDFIARNLRYRWSMQNGHPHVERAISRDNGATWQTNLIEDYSSWP